MIDPIPPTEEEIRRLAYHLFELRGGVHGWDLADWRIAEWAARFHKNYERVCMYPFAAPQKTYLGSKNPQVCRFCNRSKPDVSFRTEAHAVPACVGNQSLFTVYECDSCNNKFGSTIDDHFSKMLYGVRTAGRIVGRGGVPSYKTNRKLTRIDVVGNRLEIKQCVSDPVVSIDQETGAATFSMKTQPFIPLAVYKCLSRIALSLMPSFEIQHFAATRNWILEPDHSRGADDFETAGAFFAMTPGPFPERYGWVELFRRRHHAVKVPYMVFVLVCMNLTIQIYVPLCAKDTQLLGQQVTMPRFPAGIALDYEFGETEFENFPLSSTSAVSVSVEVVYRSDLSESGAKKVRAE